MIGPVFLKRRSGLNLEVALVLRRRSTKFLGGFAWYFRSDGKQLEQAVVRTYSACPLRLANQWREKLCEYGPECDRKKQAVRIPAIAS